MCFPYNDWTPGLCDRCGHRAHVIGEYGPLAERICQHCLDDERARDLHEYQALLHAERPYAPAVHA